MAHKIVPMEKKKRIALVAHDNTKPDLMEWTKDNKERLAQHELFATGSTGEQLENELGIEIHKLTSGPLGETSKSGRGLPRGTSIFWSFSGTLSTPSLMIRTSKPSYGWPCFGTSPWPAIGPRPIS